MGKFVVGASSDKTYEKLLAAGVIDVAPESVSRVVIDLRVGYVAKIYVETMPDKEALDAVLPDVLLEVGLALDDAA